MEAPRDLNQFKENLTRLFEKYDPESNTNRSLKAYMVESNLKVPPMIEGCSSWESMGGSWYRCNNDKDYFVLNIGSGRIWTLYSASKVKITDDIIDKWINTKGLDRCWFSGDYLLNYGKNNNWIERGIGVRYRNSIVSEDVGTHFSMKAWHGSDVDPEIQELFDKVKNKFTTTSIRWRKYEDKDISMRSEWYNNGKITIQYCNNVTEMIENISDMSKTYLNSLGKAEEYRNQNRSAFEFRFENKISLDDYTEALSAGKSSLKLWMIEIERNDDFRRYSGIDLHTGDRILLDMGVDYAYMTIPGKGCVNATPRFLTVNGENALGKVNVYYDGDEIFDGCQN